MRPSSRFTGSYVLSLLSLLVLITIVFGDFVLADHHPTIKSYNSNNNNKPSCKRSRSFLCSPMSTTEVTGNLSRKTSQILSRMPPRGGADANLGSLAVDSLTELKDFMKGSKTDALLLLFSTGLNKAICDKIKLSPILGFISLGLLMGPNGMKWITDVHSTEILAELGIVMFLFEMGIHLDLKTLLGMKQDVFGIGLSQFVTTAVVIATISSQLLKLSLPASIVIGWSLALSSSAFVLQILKDKDQLETRYGKASFGTLLLQDLMVVPLLVMMPILAGQDGVSVSQAVTKALIQIAMALAVIISLGIYVLPSLFNTVVASGSQESVIGLILGSVFGFSFFTEGLGLSNTLGPFLTGMLLAETKHKHVIEHEASPFRGILVGIFFFTVGFEIDLGFLKTNFVNILSLVTGILFTKAFIATTVCRLFDVPMAAAQRVGLVLSQGGEFAFVAFRSARAMGILSKETTKLLLVAVGLTMSLTPLLEDIGAGLQTKLKKA